MYFKIESWGDPDIFETYTRFGQMYLYHGDVNYSGEIDISDVIALVAYSFQSGVEPTPTILSADFDCSGEIDVSDLIDLITYMFAGGPYSPCNPY